MASSEPVIVSELDDFPERIKEIRIKNSITQKELAEKLNVTQQTVSALERGKLDPSLKMVFMIGAILGVGILIAPSAKSE